jgi:hypothetical protein
MDREVIDTKEARQLLTERQFEVLVTLDRHRFDGKGRATWPRWEWPEIVREIDRELGGSRGWGETS